MQAKLPAQPPRVSVVTPAYNGERFLAECIDSVIAQTYNNWELVVIDNASTDATPDIISAYRERDARIRGHRNDATVSVIENHNVAVRQMTPGAEFCKVLHVDDLMRPDCLQRMVAVADRHPSAGMIGAWAQWGERTMCRIEPEHESFFTGRDVARRALLGEIYPFLSPSCLLLRVDVLARRDAFYRESGLHADVEAAYEILRETDYAIVQAVLTTIRKHEDSVTSASAKPMNTLLASNWQLFDRFAPEFISRTEYQEREAEHLERYYKFLARSLIEGRSREFWKFHTDALAAGGHSLNRLRVTRTALAQTFRNPKTNVKRILRRAQA
ncbi:MAG: glycosyltransferase family 2 protein [Pseudomonadota bacterium]